MANGLRRPSKRQPFWHGQEFSTPKQAHLAIRRWQSTLRGASPRAEEYLVWDPSMSIVRCVAPSHPEQGMHGSGSCPFKAIVQRQTFLPALDPCDESGFFAFYCTPHASTCIASPSSPGASVHAIDPQVDAREEMMLDAPARTRKRPGGADATSSPTSSGGNLGGAQSEGMYLEAVVRHMQLLLASPHFGTSKDSLRAQAQELLVLTGQAYTSGVPPGPIALKLHDWLISQGAPLPLWPPSPSTVPSPPHGASRCSALPSPPHGLASSSSFSSQGALVAAGGGESPPTWGAKRARRWR